MQLTALSHNFRASKKNLQFTHFHQFCFNFIGKDEVFHGLVYTIMRVLFYSVLTASAARLRFEPLETEKFKNVPTLNNAVTNPN